MVPGEGPIPAGIVIVGEAPGEDEVRLGRPFVGSSGMELDKMLHEAGILRAECFVTNVCKHRPPGNKIEAWIYKGKKTPPEGFVREGSFYVDRRVSDGLQQLRKEVYELAKPRVVIALGNVSLWALTGLWGISSWRGSQLQASGNPQIVVVPTYHPAYILRSWVDRAAAVRDLKRAKDSLAGVQKPNWKFIVDPTFEQAASTLEGILRQLERGPMKLVHDIETRNGHIACSGIAWSETEALCVPFMEVGRPYGRWSEDEEAELVWLHYKVLTHKNARVVGQNYLYDAQYTLRHWCFVANFWRDTSTSHHVAFCELPKRLDFQASLYCKYYRFWKEDSKNWDPSVGEKQLWTYNCEDCVRTWEVDEVTAKTVNDLGLEKVNEFQQKLFHCTLRSVSRGLRIDHQAKEAMRLELEREKQRREEWLNEIFTHEVNAKSPTQLMRLFYEDLNLPVVLHRKTRTPTVNEEALDKLAKKEPIVFPVVKCIKEIRSIGVFVSNFLDAKLDVDGRLRCSFNPNGTVTFRYSSSQSAFWNGTNMQNIPKGTKATDPDDLELPNIRKIFVPDEGFTYFDMDLDRADLQIVVWEADDAEMKQMLREGVDLHTENAKLLGCTRQLAKVWVHGTNYGGGPRTMAVECGLTVHQAERMQKRWFSAHPGIAEWHRRTEKQAASHGYISNIFGYRRYLFDRFRLPDALAWQPQSSVGRIINTIWDRLLEETPWIHVLLQVHDSLVGQFPTHRREEALEALRRLSIVTVPYPDPLVIPVGIKISEKSWGDCA